MPKMMFKRFFTLLLLIFLVASLILSQSWYASAIDDPVVSRIESGGYAVKKNGEIIAAHNQHEKFVPASIIKIATSLAALQVLGPQHRFETRFYLDADANLYIRGFGDPYLVSEEISHIMQELKKIGCDRINNIYLDDTEFDIGGSTDGAGLSDNPYDAQNSGLAVNFNTINIRKDASGRVFSAEEQTPALPIMVELAGKKEAGVHRINISHDRPYSSEVISRYVGELFRAFQHEQKIPGNGIIKRKKTPDDLPVFYGHRSRNTLEEMIAPLMLYSNNFIANQLFLAVGAERFGYPATWEKSRRAVAGIMQNSFNINVDDIRIIEGSGLSRNNLVSPGVMIRLLDFFKPYGGTLPEEDGKLMKSGTLKGIYSYAGYFRHGENLDSFVLILNQRKNSRDELLMKLEQIYRKSN
jgi:D-alanyl-D-alanine carboxypeptidase/D-alanyl-D-alanine-endopeptidase (penicillin-binding protein 4)